MTDSHNPTPDLYVLYANLAWCFLVFVYAAVITITPRPGVDGLLLAAALSLAIGIADFLG